MTWRWIAAVTLAFAGVLVLLNSDRDAATGGVQVSAGEAVEPEPVALEPSGPARHPSGERSVLESAIEPASQEPAALDYRERLRVWEAGTAGVIEGRMIASRGIADWSSWRIYVTSRAPKTAGFFAKSTPSDVDPATGWFRVEGLPEGPTDLLWYHPVAGKGGATEIEVVAGTNPVTLTYPGPDPASALFLDVSGAEPITPAMITVSDGVRSYWVEPLAGEEGRFFVGDLVPGTYRVTIAVPGGALPFAEGGVGSRLRIELD